jgi:hypothetical protein
MFLSAASSASWLVALSRFDRTLDRASDCRVLIQRELVGQGGDDVFDARAAGEAKKRGRLRNPRRPLAGQSAAEFRVSALESGTLSILPLFRLLVEAHEYGPDQAQDRKHRRGTLQQFDEPPAARLLEGERFDLERELADLERFPFRIDPTRIAQARSGAGDVLFRSNGLLRREFRSVGPGLLVQLDLAGVHAKRSASRLPMWDQSFPMALTIAAVSVYSRKVAIFPARTVNA